MPAERKKFVEVGAGWFKDASNGTRFISGVLKVKGESIMINLFENKTKNAAKHPDYRISMMLDKAVELGLDYQIPSKDKKSPNSSSYRAENKTEEKYDRPAPVPAKTETSESDDGGDPF